MPKQKYKPTFPTSRIKQIMRTDEEVGRVAAGALVSVSKSLELFVQHLVSKTVASLGGEKKITLAHL
jgi:histone H3/H4